MDKQTSPQEAIPELAVAVPQDAAALARALDLEAQTVSTWLTQGLGIVARVGSQIVGLAHLVDDGGHADVTDLALTTPDDADVVAALIGGAEQIATELESRVLVVSGLKASPARPITTTVAGFVYYPPGSSFPPLRLCMPSEQRWRRSCVPETLCWPPEISVPVRPPWRRG